MRTTYKTAKGLTTEYIKTVKNAEASNAQYIVTLAKLAKSGKVTYNDLQSANDRLNKEAKETGIGTFKHVAMLVARMYNKKTINGKSQAFEIDFKVVDKFITLGDKVSMAKLMDVRKEGKAKQTKAKTAKPKTVNTKTATDAEKNIVDVKKETQSVRDEVLTVAAELTTKKDSEVENLFFDLVAELEELAQNIDVSKKKDRVAVATAYLQKAVNSLA